MHRALPALTLMLALALVGAGCGASSRRPTSTTTAGASARATSAASVTIRNFKYGPPHLAVTAGTKVTWRNTDSSPHTATASAGRLDTGTLKQGQSRTLTLSEPGRYAYICSFHPFMHGTVIVTAR